jgi:hypothetical protein
MLSVATVPAFVALVALLVRKRLFAYLGLGVAIVVVNLIANNPVVSARYWTAIVIAGLVGTRVDWRTRAGHAVMVTALVLVTTFSYSYLDLFRRESGLELKSEKLEDLVAVAVDYSMFQQEMNVVEYVSENGHTLGRQLTGSVGVYIPRALWTGKPVDTGDVIAPDTGGNPSASVWSELYIDFGLIGVFVGFLVLAFVVTRFERRLRSSPGSFPMVAGPILFAFSIVFLRGSLQPIIGAGVPLVGAILYVRRPQPRRGGRELTSRRPPDAAENGAMGRIPLAPGTKVHV